MRVKLDENLPISLVPGLAELGHDADSVEGEGAAGWDDKSVFRLACEADRFFITQDLHFADVRALAPGTHPGIMVVRLTEGGRRALHRRVLAIFRDENTEDWRGCLVVATENKARVQRPG
jgi:predicted nuclease of predicted toxin-antitoxin system